MRRARIRVFIWGGEGKAVPKPEHAQHCKQQINPFLFVFPFPFNQRNHGIVKVGKGLGKTSKITKSNCESNTTKPFP